MRLIEIFSGLGGFARALENLEIPHEIIAMCDIDPHAIKVYEALHGPTPNLGNIPSFFSPTDAPGETFSTGSKSGKMGMPGAGLYERSPAETAGACPLKPGLRCHATVELATESRCDCPRIPQYDLYNHHARRRPQEVPA